MQIMRLSFLLLLTGLSLLGCLSKDDTLTPEEQSATDRQIIVNYLANNNLTAEEDASGLFYIIEEPGDADRPQQTDTVTVAYRGYLTNGTVFDQRANTNPLTDVRINQFIAGWRIGLPLIGRGGEIKLLVPSRLGYGPNEVGPIPANSVLVFDVELIDF